MANTIVRHRAIVDRNEPDLPNETKATFIAQNTHGILKLRCQPEQGLRVELYYRQFLADGSARVEMKYWSEDGSKSQDKVWVTDRHRFILPNGRQIFEDALRSSVLHVQIGSASAMVFRPTSVAGALSKIQAACPSDAPPPDHNGLAK